MHDDIFNGDNYTQMSHIAERLSDEMADEIVCRVEYPKRILVSNY